MQPDDEHRRIKERERGQQARQIFDSPLWAEAYEALANEQMALILAATTPDDEVLECRRQILALHQVKRRLESVMQTGQMAAMQLEEAHSGTDRTAARRTRAAAG